MSCAAREESSELCHNSWRDACEWGREKLNKETCAAACTQDSCDRTCQKEHGRNFESYQCGIETHSNGGVCRVKCRERCSSDLRLLPSQEWYCCKNDTFIKRTAGGHHYAVCDGSP